MKRIIQVSVGLLFTFITALGDGPDTTQSLETIGVQGNWVKKRDWLLKAHEVNNEISDLATQIEQARKLFIDKNNEIDTVLVKYYQESGLEEGKTSELFESIDRYLEKKKKKEFAGLGLPEGEKPSPEVQAKIEIVENDIKNSKRALEQLKLDMTSIEDLEKSLVDRINRVDEQINLTQEETVKAKNIINALWNIVDHNKAREQYYQLKITILETVKATKNYLQEDLFKDFVSVAETIKTQITRTQEQTKKLEESGFFIKNRAEQIKEVKRINLAEQAKQAALKAQIPAPPVQPKKVPTWYEILYQKFILFFSKLYANIVNLIAPQKIPIKPLASKPDGQLKK